MEEKITAWIARAEDGTLYIHYPKPFKGEIRWFAKRDVSIDKHLFPEVKLEDDEPTKVELTIKIKK